jgi:hypothetical protein
MSGVRRESRRFCCAAVALIAAGCAPATSDAPDGPEVVVRDSAGIRIVENHLPGGAAPIYAELGAPDLEIGVVDGDPAYSFTNVVGVRALPDGGFLVAEGPARELRLFDGNGRHVRSIGRAGDGPGEFS